MLENHGALQILFEETLFQDSSDGTPLVEVLQRQGIVPGAALFHVFHMQATELHLTVLRKLCLHLVTFCRY